MARRRGGWFKVYDDILVNAKVRSAGMNAMAFVNLLAAIHQSGESDCELICDASMLRHLTFTTRVPKALSILQELQAKGLLTVTQLPANSGTTPSHLVDKWQLCVGNYAERQEIRPPMRLDEKRIDDTPEEAPKAPAQKAKKHPANGPVKVAEWAQPIFDRVNLTLDLYGAGKIDACRPGTPREGRWRLIRDRYAGGDVQAAAGMIAKAIHGYVCRNGAQDRDDFAAGSHFQLDSLLRPSHFDENLTACEQALELGWTKPFKRGSHAKGPPRRRRPRGRTELELPPAPPSPPPTEQEMREAKAAIDALKVKYGRR